MKVSGTSNLLSPLPVVLVGAVVDGKPTYCAISHIGVLDGGKRVVFSLYKPRHTCLGIAENGPPGVSLPTEEMLRTTDLCGTKSGSEIDKSGSFTTFYGSIETAPMIEECPLTMECEVDQVIEFDKYYAVIGLVVASYADEALVGEDGSPALSTFRPILYAYDNGYYALGERIGTLHKAWQDVSESG